MLPQLLKDKLSSEIAEAEHPKELVVDVMAALQDHYGYLSDEALEEAARLLKMNPLQLEELATFYTFLYREPVGKYVIHVCDSVICWLDGCDTVREYLCRKLNVDVGQTTADGLFIILPVCCIGYCDRSPAILINKKAYGPLTPEKIDSILSKIRARESEEPPG